ncbi:MAG: hypothetical protein QMD21_05425 [Candidatus Thermoplasmatota archaeon]|nr:hypothetical protein [Candidatus Thermoplasmatota archaeon]
MAGGKSDIVYYMGYGVVGILLGTFAAFWALGTLTLSQMLVLWLMFVGLALTALGCVRVSSASRMPTLVGFGIGLAIIFGSLTTVVFNFVAFWLAIAIIVILLSAGLVAYSLIISKGGK